MGDWEGKTAERTRGREKQGGQMTGVGEVGRGERRSDAWEDKTV